MRTLLHNLGLVHDRRDHEIGGIIGFISSRYDKPNLAKLRQAIIKIDAQFPWNDDSLCPDEEHESIKYLSDGKIDTDGWGEKKICRFYLYPTREYVRKGQVYGYEKYLAKLAEELAKLNISGVQHVRSTIQIHATTDFKSGRIPKLS
jgi:hypothetical protein